MWEMLKTLQGTLICGVLLMMGYIFGSPWFFILAIILGGYEQTKEGLIDTFKHKRLNVELLMILSAIGACIIGNYAEGAVLIFIFSLSGSLEELTLDRSQREIRSLMEHQPVNATRILANGNFETVAVADVQVGDVLLVKVGETIALDGTILEGKSSIEEASITGESLPAEKHEGSAVYGGTLNVAHPIRIKVSHAADDILIQKIVKMVEEAEGHASNTSRLIDRIEDKYARMVLLVVALVIIVPWFFMGETFYDAFYRGMVLLVVASPCALIASVTPATLSAISNGAKHGILVKGGLYFENLMDMKAVAFDKTGTLTQGKPQLMDMFLQDDSLEVVKAVIELERHSSHPLAQALVEGLQERYPDTNPVAISLKDVSEKAGFGVSGHVNDHYYQIGKLESMQVGADSVHDDAQKMMAQGHTLVYIQQDEAVIGVLGLLDDIRADAQALIMWLNEQNIETIMITGDTEATAHKIAERLGITRVIARCLPDEKAQIVQDLKQEYTHVMMVGDGINDAPALANASIGVAMSGGTDIALETADVILVKDSLLNLRYAIELSRRLRKIIKQNIIFSLAVIVILVVSNFFNIINLPIGVVGHEGSTILVILNSLRLLKPLRK